MITIFMGGFSILMESQLYAYIAIVVLTFLLLNSDRNYAFYSVLGTVFFWEAIRINGLGMGFYFSFILLFKFLIDQRNYLTVGKAFQVLVFLMIFFINDILYCDLSQTTHDISKLLLLFVCLNCLDFEKYNHRYALLAFITSLVLCQCFSIYISGGLAYFQNVENVYLRLGETGDTSSLNPFGGAMGFPVNSILICTFSVALLADKYEQKWVKFSLLVVIIVSILMAFFSTSRVYLLGLSVMILLFVMKALKTSKAFYVFVFFIAVLVFIVSTGILDNYLHIIESRYLSRTDNLSSDLSNGRSIIYSDILLYLSDNPHRILVGCGYRAYQQIGKLNNLAFAMSTHNIVFDALMAFGLYGIFLIISSCTDLARRIRKRIPTTITIISIMPLVCWFSTSLTNSAFMLSKTYVLIPFFILHLYYGQYYLIRNNNVPFNETSKNASNTLGMRR
jgi:hypothetical protein